MHTIILGKDAEYVHLAAEEKGQLFLKDGTQYMFYVIEFPYWTSDAPDRNGNLIMVKPYEMSDGDIYVAAQTHPYNVGQEAVIPS